jgi:AsmA-like C-terminal region
MAAPILAAERVRSVDAPDRVRRPHKVIIVVAIAAVLLCGAAGFYYIRMLSFSEKKVLLYLSEASGTSVTAKSYHRTRFPAPGCVLEGVEFRKQTNNFMLVQIDKLVIKGSYSGLLRNHVQHVKAVGARIFIPPFGSNFTFQTEHSNIVVDEVIANGASVQFGSADSREKPLVFDVHEALLNDVRWGSPIPYQLKFHNPEPPGEISVRGKFGPWAKGHPNDTPMSGEFSFDHADLSTYGGISGLLSAKGKFQGAFEHIDVDGTTDTPDFEVTSGGHKTHLTSSFDAYVNAMHGDTFLKRVEAHLGRTIVIARGSVAGVAGKKGKFGELELNARQGHIEDLLGLFASAPRSPMSGKLSFKTRAEIQPGNAPFLKRTRLAGAFGVDAGSFSNADTQDSVDTLSAGARGQDKEDPETVLTDLKGQVDLTNGTARFSELSFGAPGVKAEMQGTYDILNYKIDLHGRMRVDTKISNTSSGVKALLLKVMDPLFKKKKQGEIIPVHITGTYQKPEFGLDLSPQSKSPGPPRK